MSVNQSPPSPTSSDSTLIHEGEEYSTLLPKKSITDFTVSASFQPIRYERQLGDNEVSYFLPSRATGVNDMYLHLDFRAPSHLLRRARVRMVWAILRVRHPLLASQVCMHDYNDVRFVYTPPQSAEDASNDANNNLQYRSSTKDTLIDNYLNGPRTLSNECLSYLIISSEPSTSLPTPPTTPPLIPHTSDKEDTVLQNYGLMICAVHFLGDGMALHQFANDFFALLGSSKTQADLEALLREEWHTRCGGPIPEAGALPESMERRFRPETSRFRRAVGKVDFQRSQGELIGGQTFPRRSKQPKHTVVKTVAFDLDRTKAIIRQCKTHGVSPSAAFFAVCNIAWIELFPENKELPMMMYSAVNIRPCFTAKALNDSYWFLALGFFNVILPSFIPGSIDLPSVFWHRARMAKEQSTRAAKSLMIVSRSCLMAEERGLRARIWAKEDDGKGQYPFVAPPPATTHFKATALMGLSLLGNLDGIYKYALFPEIQFNSLATGSRQRSGGMLLFSYTFAGQLFISLSYDQNGFEEGCVERFWENILHTTDKLM